ncbi:putative E3 ubiquitin-protein ligase RING1a isoform X2 [Papaver somniferum]|uniref:putative E3 ubiquitin-protein ligase RING1a isoform X2 n=1 Tax=Papaver somniferum TaxID=3469 RepID=UPI000E700479|nr:putative E3 ubiquitin-protein ligase RING1a isoform X2 [Papaver somniferum]
MPAQKRSSDSLEVEEEEESSQQQERNQHHQSPPQKVKAEENDDGDDDDDEEEEDGDGDEGEEDTQGGGGVKDGDGGDSDGTASSSSSSDADNNTKDEFVWVKLSDIRKEVQCPICLGIIRKTRTVMECLHRFCRECIDKSMRLGNNECPACRTHCASRRSLRDDPNYDALIASIYPDIDKYEEEEMAFHEEEKSRNKQIQASIAQTIRRQSEALVKRRSTAKATAAAFVRRSRRWRNSRTQGTEESDDDADGNGNEGGRESSSADEHCINPKVKRHKRWTGQRFSQPSSAGVDADGGSDENDDVEAGIDNRGPSPGLVGTPEVLTWGKGGVRSHTRYGSVSGSNGKNARGSRLNKLSDYLRNLEENENELDVHLTLLPLDEQSMRSLPQPYLCCRPTLSVKHLCQNCGCIS